MSSVQGALSTAARGSSSRAVHIKISPRTQSMHESREILRVLKGFGDVVWYQNLKYDRTNPALNTLICIYAHAISASDLIRASPMRFSIPPPPSLTTPIISAVAANVLTPFTPSLTASHQSSSPSTESSSADAAPEKEFQLTADVSLIDHEAALMQKEFSWGFRMHMRNQAQAALARHVPEQGMAVLTAEQRTVPARIVARETKAVDKMVQDLRERLRT